MDNLSRKLNKLYLQNVIENSIDDEVIKGLLKKHGQEKDCYVSLAAFIHALTPGTQEVRTFSHYLGRYDIGLNDVILHLHTIETDLLPIVEDLQEAMGHARQGTVRFHVSYILTKSFDLVMLKVHVYEDEVVYFTMKLDLLPKESFAENHFFIHMLPEFLPFIHLPQKEELYRIKKELHHLALKYFTQYSRQKDLAIIEKWLYSQCGFDWNLRKDGKKVYIEIVRMNAGIEYVQYIPFFESEMELVETKYRTRNTPQIQDGVIGYIVKAKEPVSTKCHYIFAGNIEKEVNDNFERKTNRLHISVLFSKSEHGYELDKGQTRNSKITYTNLYEVTL